MAEVYRDPLLYLMTRVEADPGHGWNAGKPHTSIPATWWIAQYRGWLKAPKPGKYTLLVDAEAKAIGAIRHPRVVQVYESGYVGDRPYLAMEFIEP